MTVKEVTGDIFELDVDALGHGVNCRGKMGAGIAVQFKKKFPYMYDNYRSLCASHYLHLGQVYVYKPVWTTHDKRLVYNIASQDLPGANANLEAIRVAVEFVRFDAERRGLNTVALPQIGCGIGGLEWAEVKEVLREAFESSPVEFQLVTYDTN
jgi:O-acetyl-ADP-ribose deacetylase (regulator of RNase III)